MSEEKNSSFISKIANIWYYYKWAILIGAVVLIFFVTAAVQSLSKVSPDAMILYAGSESISKDVYDTLETEMSDIMKKDYNGDHHKKADILQITFHMFTAEGEENKTMYSPTEQTDTKKHFDIELSMGSSVIYILDKSLYTGLKNYLLPLKDALGYQPENALDEYAIPLADTALYRSTAFHQLPDDLVLCVRAKRNGNIIKANDKQEYYNNNLAFFKDLVEYKGE